MKKLEVNELDWSVIFTDDVNSKITKSQDETILGLTNITKLEIYIDKGLPKKLVRRTLIHELTHVFLFSYGHTAETMNEEDVCDFVESHCDRIEENVNYIMNHYERGTV